MADNTFNDLIPNSKPQPTADNPYADLVPKKGDNSNQDSGAFMASVDQFNRSFGRMSEGVLHGGAELSSYLGGGQAMKDYAGQVNNLTNSQDSAAAQSAAQHPTAAKVGSIVGNTARFLPVAAATGGLSVPGQLATGGIGAGAQTAIENTPNESGEDKFTNSMDSAAGGVAGTGIGLGLAKGIGLLSSAGNSSTAKEAAGFIKKAIAPYKSAVTNIANKVTNAGGLDKVLPRGEAASNLGTWLSPAEQIGTSDASKAESSLLLPNEAGKSDLMAATQGRDDLLHNTFNKTVDDMVPNGVEATTKEKNILFNNMKSDTVPGPKTLSNMQGNINQMKSDPNVPPATVEAAQNKLDTFAEQIKNVQTNPVISKYVNDLNNSDLIPKDIKELPMNSVAKLQLIKQNIDHDLWSNSKTSTGDSLKKLNPGEYTALTQANSELKSVLSQSSPNFDRANKLAQQLILQKRVKADIASIPNLPGAKGQPSITQIQDKLFPTPQKTDNYLRMVSETGGDPKVAKNLIETMNDIKNSPINDIVARPAGLSATNIAGRNIGIVQRFLVNLVHGRYNDAYSKLLTNNAWQPVVAHALAQKTQMGVISHLANVFNAVNKSGAAKAVAKSASVAATPQSGALLQNYFSPNEQKQ